LFRDWDRDLEREQRDRDRDRNYGSSNAGGSGGGGGRYHDHDERYGSHRRENGTHGYGKRSPDEYSRGRARGWGL